jgi:hypothetical protein
VVAFGGQAHGSDAAGVVYQGGEASGSVYQGGEASGALTQGSEAAGASSYGSEAAGVSAIAGTTQSSSWLQKLAAALGIGGSSSGGSKDVNLY